MDPNEESQQPLESDDPVEELMAECLELEADARPARLAELCSAYPELASELRERFELLLDMGIEITRISQTVDTFPDRLGGFRLLERLGGGGMGVVFRAEEESLGREVALKLIRPEHLYFPKSRERFRREVEAVARLSHPGVVPVYSVGEEAGIPYFAMELVRGATLADVLHRVEGRAPESLTGEDLLRCVDPTGTHASASSDGSPYAGGWVEACLHIVKCVAEALAHAHECDILHRDIKPSNIALSRDGRPMLLDFGLTSSSDEERATRTGTQLGTLPYMSPEQVRGSSDIDARTDVYSLGITLYELLALQVPYRAENRILTEALILGARPDPVRARNRRVSSEIEVVCLKAMDPDRARRYATAADFARDVGNLLAHRPIEARPAGPWLRAKRWAQRNPARATALVLVLAMLVGVPSALFVLQRAHAKDLEASLERVKDEVTTSNAVLNFVLHLLQEAAPERSQGQPLQVIELLKRANDKITPDEFKNQPLVRARLLANLGQVDIDVGLYQQGLKLLQEASNLYRSVPETDPRDFAMALTYEAEARRIMGDNEGAAKVAKEAHERWSEIDGAQSQSAATALGNIANAQLASRRYDEAEVSYREAIRQMRALGADAEADLPGLLGNLANVLTAKRSMDEAEDLSREALAIEERVSKEPSPRIAAAQNMLALTLKLTGRLDEAQALYEKANAQWRVLFPNGSEQLALGLSNLGSLYFQRADFERAEELTRESLAVARRVFPADHPQIETLLDILCNMLCTRHRFREAAPLLDELLPMRVRLHGDDAWNLRPAAEFAAMGLEGEYPDEKPIQIARRLVPRIWPGIPETDAHLVFALHVVGNAADKYGHADFGVEAHRVAQEIHDRAGAPAADQR